MKIKEIKHSIHFSRRPSTDDDFTFGCWDISITNLLRQFHEFVREKIMEKIGFDLKSVHNIS